MTRETEINERPEIPDVVKARRPRPERCAIETFNLPNDWQVVAWEKVGMDERGDYQHLEMKGGVYRHTIEKGKRKGEPDYKRPEPGTVATISVTPGQIEAWLDRWEMETGYCHKCDGTGFEWSGWSAQHGHRYRSCDRCKQTGRSLPTPPSGGEG